MAEFPQPLSLPADVFASRQQRSTQILGAAKLGIRFRLAIILFEFLGVLYISSSALFLDAISSLMDAASSIFLIFCLKLAQRPPDHDHPFGHGRYEPLGGLLLGVFMVFLGTLLFFQQIMGVLQESEYHQLHPLAWIFPGIAMLLLEIAYRMMREIARREHSPALAADAVHYRIDSLSSFFATGALMIAAYWPEWGAMIDHGGALVIALFMVVLGVLAARENFHQLMDKVPSSQFFEWVREAALRVPGVEETEKIRIQQYGPDAHVDIDIEVHPGLSVDKAHEITQLVRIEIQKAWPAVRDVTVHVEPYYANDH